MINTVKGTKFIDIDGTILHITTGKPLGNVVSIINKWYDEGYMIVLTTLRGDLFTYPHPYSKAATEVTLGQIGLKYTIRLYIIARVLGQSLMMMVLRLLIIRRMNHGGKSWYLK